MILKVQISLEIKWLLLSQHSADALGNSGMKLVDFVEEI